MMKKSKILFSAAILSMAVWGYAQTGTGFNWTFKAAQDETNWGIVNAKAKSIDPAGLKLVSGEDVMMYIFNQSINADVMTTIEITMSSDKPANAQVFFTAAGGDFSEKNSFVFPVSVGEKVYRINCKDNPAWTGMIEKFRFDPTMSVGDTVVIKAIRVLPAMTQWQFNSAKQQDGWGANPDVTKIQYTGDALSFVSGNDPMFISGKLGLQVASYKGCEVVMKVDRAEAAQLFFLADNKEWSEQSSCSVSVAPGGEWQTYRFDCSGKPGWTGTLKQLRFDPVNAPGINVQIKSIRMF